MGTLREMNIFVRSHLSALEPDQVSAVRVRWEREKRKAAEPAAAKKGRRKAVASRPPTPAPAEGKPVRRRRTAAEVAEQEAKAAVDAERRPREGDVRPRTAGARSAECRSQAGDAASRSVPALLFKDLPPLRPRSRPAEHRGRRRALRRRRPSRSLPTASAADPPPPPPVPLPPPSRPTVTPIARLAPEAPTSPTKPFIPMRVQRPARTGGQRGGAGQRSPGQGGTGGRPRPSSPRARLRVRAAARVPEGALVVRRRPGPSSRGPSGPTPRRAVAARRERRGRRTTSIRIRCRRTS